MTFAQQKAMIEALTGDTLTQAQAEVYLSLSGQKILNRLFPFNKKVTEVPIEYHTHQCELASRLWLRKGAEGEMIHNENGVNRTYESTDDRDILDKIIPFARIV